ncbi:MAG: CYTH domain-containing protein [Chloroflexi bacterium]|nr:CYTH domain-containing protein [Chloroflexota bacterium]
MTTPPRTTSSPHSSPSAGSSELTAPEEVELKLVVRGENPADTLAAISRLVQLGDARLGPPRRLSMHDLYWDTPERVLGASHVSLRLRTVDGAMLLTTKGATQVNGGLFRRRELELPADRAGWKRIRGALRVEGIKLRNQTADSPRPVDWLSAAGLVVTQDRVTGRTLRVAYQGERAIAEIACDVTRFNFGGRTADYHEVEVEQLSADAPVRSLGRALVARFPGQLEPARIGKYARGLQLERELAEREGAG